MNALVSLPIERETSRVEVKHAVHSANVHDNLRVQYMYATPEYRAAPFVSLRGMGKECEYVSVLRRD